MSLRARDKELRISVGGLGASFFYTLTFDIHNLELVVWNKQKKIGFYPRAF